MAKRITKGKVYSHPDNLDVDFYVNKVKYQGDHYTIFDVTYYHKTYRYIIESQKNVKIFKKHRDKWVEIA